MMFATEATRNAFYALPTANQMTFIRMEDILANDGKIMNVSAVIRDPLTDTLEVMVRITDKFHLNPVTAD